MDSDLTEHRALEAEKLSASQPARARRIAESSRLAALKSGNALALSIAERALGLAAIELNELPVARGHLLNSILVADEAGLATEAAEGRIRMASVLSLMGDTATALAQLQLVDSLSRGVTRARSRAHQALLYQRIGRADDALELYRLAIPVLHRMGFAGDEAKALSNRAVLHTYRGDYAAAEADLSRAQILAPAAGPGFSVAKLHHNLGFVAACRGNIPKALAEFDEAQHEYAESGMSGAGVLSDRAEVLLTVGMAGEALTAVSLAVEDLEQSDGAALDLAEVRLMKARALLVVGNHREAIDTARKARSSFRRQRRDSWRVLCDCVIAQAQLSTRLLPLRSMTATADELREAGWLQASLELRLAWALRALRRPLSKEVVEQLSIIAAHRRRGPVQVRAYAWHAEALLRLNAGTEAGCQSAIRAGLNVLNHNQSLLGAIELRVNAASRTRALAVLGCQLALKSEQAARVFDCAERWRAGALRFQPVRPTEDKQLDTLLEQLRHASTSMNQAALDGLSTEVLLRQLAALEVQIRDRARHSSAPGFDSSTPPPSPDRIRAALGDHIMIAYLALDGQLHAVTLTQRRIRLFHLGSVQDLLSEVDSLRFSHARLAKGRGSQAAKDTFAAAANHAAGVLDSLLFAALRAEVDDRPVVIIPTGRLHHLPWLSLPTCATRSVSVAPSAALWAKTVSSRVPKTEGATVLVAGPGMDHAEPEIAKLKTLYPKATRLVGTRATVDRVSGALDGAQTAHIAAHGSYRGDNPLFSSLQLSDGHLTMFNLERIRTAPQLLVLSACESGLSDVRPGDELLGLSATVLSQGTRNLMASVVSVSDVTTAALMVEVHRRLRLGETPPSALTSARQALDATGEAPLVTTAGFVSFGA
jgi:tetratricopeptide (TPR) repeat protein